MPISPVDALQHYLSRLCDVAVQQEDEVLLKQFVSANDRAAFELLVERLIECATRSHRGRSTTTAGADVGAL